MLRHVLAVGMIACLAMSVGAQDAEPVEQRPPAEEEATAVGGEADTAEAEGLDPAALEDEPVPPVAPVQGLKERPRYGTELPEGLPSIEERQRQRRMGLAPGQAGQKVPEVDATDKIPELKQNRPRPDPVKWPPKRKRMVRQPHPHPAVVSVKRPREATEPQRGRDLVWVNMPGRVYFEENNNHVHTNAVQISREKAIEMGYRPAYTPIPVRPAIEVPKMPAKSQGEGSSNSTKDTEQ